MIKNEAKKDLTKEQFVTRWCQAAKQGKSLSEFVEGIGGNYPKVHAKYRSLLAMGVELPALRGQRSDYHLETVKLNQIVVQVMGKSSSTKTGGAP